MIYDVVMCIHEKDINISIISIKSLIEFSNAKKIFLISSLEAIEKLKILIANEYLNKIEFIDEDSVIDGIQLESINKILKSRINSSARSGWYYLQFLKMAIANHVNISDYYLIWDSDTVMLGFMDFFDNKDRIIINVQKENHLPYFVTLKSILGIEKQVDFSFISEHFMIKTEYMRKLLNELSDNSFNISWSEFILIMIDDNSLSGSGFSEYETYGNFVSFYFQDSFHIKKTKSTRHGKKLFGDKINKYALFSLMLLNYKFASFESWERVSYKSLIRNFLAKFLYLLCNAIGFHKNLVIKANKIVNDK